MLKKLLWSILILLMVSSGGAVYLHHHNQLAAYSPELDRLVMTMDQQVQGAWRATARIRALVRELTAHLEPLKKLMKYLPEMDAPQGTRDPEGETRTGLLEAFQPRPQSPAPPPETIYTWVDRRGVRHFSSTRPKDAALDVNIIQR